MVTHPIHNDKKYDEKWFQYKYDDKGLLYSDKYSGRRTNMMINVETRGNVRIVIITTRTNDSRGCYEKKKRTVK